MVGENAAKTGKNDDDDAILHFWIVISCLRRSPYALHSRYGISRETRWSWRCFKGYFAVYNTLQSLIPGIVNYPRAPPQIALNDSKSSLGDVFQHSLPKYAKQTIFTSNHVSWGGQLYPLNTFPVSKSILKTFVGSYGDFFDEMTLKIAKFISFQKERNFAILSVISSKKCP